MGAYLVFTMPKVTSPINHKLGYRALLPVIGRNVRCGEIQKQRLTDNREMVIRIFGHISTYVDKLMATAIPLIL